VLRTKNLSKTYDEQTACEDICLSIKEGQVFGLLGPNGAGKSTLVKMLIGLVRPSSGQALIMGQRAGSLEIRYKIGYLPEMFRFYEWLTGWELLRFFAQVYRIPVHQEKLAIQEVLELVGLKGREKDKIKSYSKGMQQRLGLARAVLHQPALVFLDEPTSALDPLGRRDVRDALKRLQQKGTTIFLNSHLLGEVEMTCSHLGFIRQGHLVAAGPVEDFISIEQDIIIEVDNLDHELLSPWNKDGRIVRVNDHLLQFTAARREEVPVLINKIAEAGGQIYRVENQSRGLEEVFVELIENNGAVIN